MYEHDRALRLTLACPIYILSAHLRPERALGDLSHLSFPPVRLDLLLGRSCARAAAEAAHHPTTRRAAAKLMRACRDARLEGRAFELGSLALSCRALCDPPLALELREALDVEVLPIVPEIGADVILTRARTCLRCH
jgi:hypothetical protein